PYAVNPFSVIEKSLDATRRCGHCFCGTAETVALNHPKESGMSHQDTDGLTASVPNHQALKQALDCLLASACLSNVAFREDCSWTPKGLIIAAILWVWSDEKTLSDRFLLARKVVMAMATLTRMPATSYQAFLKMLNADFRRGKFVNHLTNVSLENSRFVP